MYITGGFWKGQSVYSHNKNAQIRPTLNQHRQTIFHILFSLGYTLEERLVLDAYAGTGIMGFECLSRGAAHCHFIDYDTNSIHLINKNIHKLRANDYATTIKKDLTKTWYLPQTKTHKNRKIDIVFLDPPYDHKMADKTLDIIIKNKIIHSQSVIIVEESSHANLIIPQEMEIITQRVKGNTCFWFLCLNKKTY